MKILFTSSGTDNGSWAIRGVQIAAAIGARAIHHATEEDCRRVDLIVVVKRIGPELLENIRSSGRPWVYDIVDAYPQREGVLFDHGQSKQWLCVRLRELMPNLVIWPNARMQQDYGPNSIVSGEVIYHHYRPGIALNPIREEIKTIGYEGREDYLGKWIEPIKRICKANEWRFVVNPKRLADLDVVLALRSDEWNGYPQRHWKSNVKLANAFGSCTPFIGMPENGYIETESPLGCEYIVSDQGCIRDRGENDLVNFLENLRDQSSRAEIASEYMRWRDNFSIENIAKRYEQVLCAVK